MSSKANYAAHREERLAWQAKYYAAHKVERAAYYAVHREERLARQSQWRKAHPSQRRDMNNRRRARKLGNGPNENVDIAYVWVRDHGVCGLCHIACDWNDWHPDHIIPLSRGGTHTFANVQVTHPKCNLSKHDKLIEEL